jgi:hypothetical protein
VTNNSHYNKTNLSCSPSAEDINSQPICLHLSLLKHYKSRRQASRVMMRLSTLLGQSHQFIHTFCDPEAFSGHFSGDLGAWTPCFIDVGLLGECCTSGCSTNAGFA